MSVCDSRQFLSMVLTALAVAATLPISSADAAAPPSVKQALSIVPVQKDVEIETPTSAEDLAKCTLTAERGKYTGWTVVGPSGQTLRRFLDTNNDVQLDEWRYFNHGVEVYRDMDTNNNKKADQSRWLNLGGTRWGLDPNEDGRIDSWKMISAPEAAREAVRALIARDEVGMRALMLTAEDVRTLQIDASLGQKLLDQSKDVTAQLAAALEKSKTIKPATSWMRFDAQNPCLIPADDGKARGDLLVYENAMAIVDTQGKSSVVQIGEMIRVGDVWRITRVPVSIEGEAGVVDASVSLLQPVIGNVTTPNGSPVTTAEAQKLLEELQALDQKAPPPAAGPEALAKYNARRAQILMELMKQADGDEERDQWARQLADGLVASIQTGAYPEGVTRLRELDQELKHRTASAPVQSYVSYRRMLADYTVAMTASEPEKQSEAQKTWLAGLEAFIRQFPKEEDSGDAMLQLAMNEEFSGRTKEAESWYRQLATSMSKSRSGQKAAGALRRFDLKGQAFTLSGPTANGSTLSLQTYRKRIVLVAFWATWCQPYTTDLPELRALYAQYKAKGFEIVGVNLDATPQPVAAYEAQNKVTWPSILATGGLEDSEVALQYGIMSLPTMFLVDGDGKVISRASSVAELKTVLPTLLAPAKK